jgi:hypothetical protein
VQPEQLIGCLQLSVTVPHLPAQVASIGWGVQQTPPVQTLCISDDDIMSPKRPAPPEEQPPSRKKRPIN